MASAGSAWRRDAPRLEPTHGGERVEPIAHHPHAPRARRDQMPQRRRRREVLVLPPRRDGTVGRYPRYRRRHPLGSRARRRARRRRRRWIDRRGTRTWRGAWRVVIAEASPPRRRGRRSGRRSNRRGARWTSISRVSLRATRAEASARGSSPARRRRREPRRACQAQSRPSAVKMPSPANALNAWYRGLSRVARGGRCSRGSRRRRARRDSCRRRRRTRGGAEGRRRVVRGGLHPSRDAIEEVALADGVDAEQQVGSPRDDRKASAKANHARATSSANQSAKSAT